MRKQDRPGLTVWNLTQLHKFFRILNTIPCAVAINPGFVCFRIFEVFVTHCCEVVFVKLLNGTDSAEDGEFIQPRAAWEEYKRLLKRITEERAGSSYSSSCAVCISQKGVVSSLLQEQGSVVWDR